MAQQSKPGFSDNAFVRTVNKVAVATMKLPILGGLVRRGLVEIRYVGASGKTFEIPVNYRRSGDSITIWVRNARQEDLVAQLPRRGRRGHPRRARRARSHRPCGGHPKRPRCGVGAGPAGRVISAASPTATAGWSTPGPRAAGLPRRQPLRATTARRSRHRTTSLPAPPSAANRRCRRARCRTDGGVEVHPGQGPVGEEVRSRRRWADHEVHPVGETARDDVAVQLPGEGAATFGHGGGIGSPCPRCPHAHCLGNSRRRRR